MKILIIVAKERKKRGFLDKVDFSVDYYLGFDFFRFFLDDKECLLVKTEVGKTNAAIVSSLFISKFKPKYVINAGIGGAMCENINVKETVIGSKVAYYDVDLTAFNLKKGQLENHDLFFKTSKKLLNLSDDSDLHGLVVSGDSFVSNLDKALEIKKDFPKALVCDMESGAIAQTCNLFKKQFLVIRCISDNVYKKFDNSEYEENKNSAIKIVVKKTLDIIHKIDN